VRVLIALACLVLSLAACGDDDFNQDLGQGCNGCDLSATPDLTGADLSVTG
jgi:hypothetical protein